MIPSDVPIHRPSVGAMGPMADQYPARITKPYVYRGTGEDRLTPNLGLVPKPKPKPKPKPRRKPKPRPHYWANRSVPQSGWVPPKPAPFVVPEPDPEPWTDPVLDVPIARPLRPAPGWRPTTGEDLAALLEEIGL